MELDELRALLLVAETGQFTAAARRLRRSRPSVSAYINNLETELGCQLLDRTTRPVTPTEAGRTLIEELQTSLPGIDRAVAVTKRVAATGMNAVRVGHNGTAGVYLVQQALSTLSTEHTDITLQLHEGPTNTLVNRLRTRDLDLALVRPPLHHEELDETWVGDETLAVIVPKTHHLAKAKSVALAALADEPFILPSHSRSGRAYDTIIDACWTHGHFKPRLAQEATTTISFLALVAAGSGVAILPRRSIAYCQTRGVKILSISDRVPRLPLHLAWHRENISPQALQVRTAIIDAAHHPTST